MKIYSNTDELILDVPVTDDSYRYYELGVEDYIECEFYLNELVDIPTGARIGYDGEVYTLYIAPQVEKLNDHSYRYTARFEGYMGMLKRYIFHNIPDGRVSFSLTATPAEHLTMILDNMNERDGETSYGKQWRDNDNQCITADAKTISYDKLNCLEALQLMAAEFDTEFEVIRVVKRGFVNNSPVIVDRYYDIVVKKVAYGKDTPLKLSYGKGKGFREDISRVAENESAPVGVMWAKGGDRNINAASYGHTTLQLPAGSYWYADGKLYNEKDSHHPANAQLFVVPDGKNYVQRKGSTNAVEACIDCSDIYPHREGKVTKAGVEGNDNAYYAIVDDTIPDDLNYDNYKINGQEPTIVFQSGMLAGKEFRINGYNHTERKFVIARQAIDGVYMPSDEFPVTAGDKYAIFGISVPEAFITEASRAMLVKAIEELLRVEQPRYLYTGQIDGIWAKNDWTTKHQNLRVGGYIEYDELGAQNTLLRIEAVKEYLNNPYSLELTFGDRFLKPRYRISTLVSTSESITISAQESSKQQLINASATTSAASLDKAIIALRGAETDTSADLTIYGSKKYAKEQADGVLGAKTDVAGKLTVYGTRNYIDKIFSPIIKGNTSLIGLLFFGGRNVSTDIYVPKPLVLFDPSLDFSTRYDVQKEDKVLNPPNYESAYYVKITTSNHTNYIGAVISIEVDVTSDEFTDAFGYALHAGDWLVASPYGWKKISGSDVGGSNGVDFEEVKNWVETKLQSYAKMPTEQPIQDSILIYDSSNQTFKGSNVQISTTVQDIENGEDSKIPTCGQVIEFVEETVLTKQDVLISGENIKTVFGQSVLGSGDVLGEFSLEIQNTGTYRVESIANARIVRNGVTTPIDINVETHIANGSSVYVTLSQSGELQVRGTIGGVYLTYLANGTIQDDFIPSTIARTAYIKQSDWNEGDSSSNAYINNRTHYFQPYSGYGDLSTYSTSVGENFGPVGEYFSLGGYVYKSSDIVGQEFNCAPYGPSVIVSVVIEAPNGYDEFFLKFVSGTLSPGISIPFCGAGFAKPIDEAYIPNGVARTKDLNVRNVCIVDTEAEIDDTISFATTEYVDTAIATAITTTLNTPV